MSAALLLDGLAAYARLSREGRKALRAFAAKERGGGSSSRVSRFFADPANRRRLLRSLVLTDRAFSRFVPDSVLRAEGRDRWLAWQRTVPFACVNLEIITRWFEAFGFVADDPALDRLILRAFMWREMNDLFDRHPRAEVYRSSFPLADPPGPFPLVYHFGEEGRRQRAGQEERFARYIELMANTVNRVGSLMGLSQEEALVGRAGHLARMAAFGTFPEMPDALLAPLADLTLWLLALDEFSDIERDRAAGKASFLATLADPEAYLLARVQACETAFLTAAREPELILPLLRLMTEETIDARRQGRDLESEMFFGGAPRPQERSVPR